MHFTNVGCSISSEDITAIENQLHLCFPYTFRKFYLKTNGGIPEPYVFENDAIDTVVSEVLPLKAESRNTAPTVYNRLVLDKHLVPIKYFPFAVDGGGDYFFIDCETSDGFICFYNSDTNEQEHLIPLNMNLDQFFETLKSE
jgi:hypothetical protein